MDTERKIMLSAGDCRLSCRMYGNSGPALLFLHGNGEDGSCFEQQIGPFSDTYRLYLLDSRGHGESERGEKPMTIALLAQDALCAMTELNLNEATVIGFSDGGNVALQMAMYEPERISRMVLAGANLSPEGLKNNARFEIGLHYVSQKLMGRFSAKWKAKSEITGLMVGQPQFDSARLRGIRIPTLVLAGEHDMIKEYHTRLIASSLANSELAILPGANHFIFSCASERANEEISKFLSK